MHFQLQSYKLDATAMNKCSTPDALHVGTWKSADTVQIARRHALTLACVPLPKLSNLYISCGIHKLPPDKTRFRDIVHLQIVRAEKELSTWIRACWHTRRNTCTILGAGMTLALTPAMILPAQFPQIDHG